MKAERRVRDEAPWVVLLSLHARWLGSVRLPMALKRAGFRVAVVCPQGSPLLLSRHVDYAQRFNPVGDYGYIPRWVLVLALAACLAVRPRFVIPGDEDAMRVLRDLRRVVRWLPLPHLRKAIESSLWSDQRDEEVLDKGNFVRAVSEWGLSTPTLLSEDEALARVGGADGAGVVVKGAAGCGGSSVKMCRDVDSLRAALTELKGTTFAERVRRTVKQLIFYDFNSLPTLLHIQDLVEGDVGMLSFVAFRGKLLEAICAFKTCTYPTDTGPSSVITGHRDERLFHEAEIIVERLGYSGFGSFDFIRDRKSGRCYIIELNGRVVPISHIAGPTGVDLPVRLSRALDGDLGETRYSEEGFVVALYPTELRRDPNSRFIREHYHDVPDDTEEFRLAIGGEVAS